MREFLHFSRFIWVQKKDAILSIVFGFIAGITTVALFAANGYLIAQAALQPPLYVLIFMVGVVKFGSLLRASSRYAERYFSHRATFTMLAELRASFYQKLEPIAGQLFQRYRSGDLLSRIVGDVESIQNIFLRVIYPPIVMLLVFVCTMIFVSHYSFLVVLLIFIGLIITSFVVPALFVWLQKKQRSRIREARGELSTEATEWVYGYRELKLHQALESKEHQLLSLSEQYADEQEKSDTTAVHNQAMNTMAALIILWAIIAVGAFLTAGGVLNGLYLAMLVMIALSIFEQSTPMAVQPLYYDETEQSANRLQAIVEQDEQGSVITDTPSSVEWIPRQAPSIEMKDISFTYADEQRPTLDRLNLYVPPGSKTAIVGPSGCGKSTLLQLILKLQMVDHGEILVDGYEISSIDQEQIWQAANVILQENHFFFGTIRDNLLLGDDAWSDLELEQLLEDVQLPHFNLQSQVLEKGQNLSGGEKQRLAMARAIAKGSRLWLLDEPTSALDAATERKLIDLLHRHAQHDTVVLISHRLEGLGTMDQIIVMDQGKVIESGTFDQLMRNKGYFYKMKNIEDSVIDA